MYLLSTDDDFSDNNAEEPPYCKLYKDRNCKGCPFLEDFEGGKLIEEMSIQKMMRLDCTDWKEKKNLDN